MSVKIGATRSALHQWWRGVSASAPGVPHLTQPTVCEVLK